jgi:hypothetical protein
VQRPAAWILLVLLAAASATAAWIYFPQAFSILSLDIAMDRGAALARARDLAARHGLGPAAHRQAASFSLDSETQTFVELEGGGKDVFTAMLRDGLYAAYAWRVRHFQPGEITEVTFRFRPDGQPYGFVERLPEDQPGAALAAGAARALAEARAVADWHVDLGPYALVEQGQEVRPGGRVDHTFTYERAAPTLGEGRYRLRLTVAGDRLTEVTHFVRIPEAFTRRYASMRSANDTIGMAASFSMLLLYGVGGIGVGLFFMMRRRWVIWRPAIGWAVFIAALQTLAIVNDWPLQWMSYDTALPYPTFLIQQAALLAATFFGLTTLFALSFVAAETLTRRAFGSHPQFWRLWGREAGSSKAVLGRTTAGYLLVTVFLAYDVLLYLFATRTLGWWSPAESLVHPDVLASYVPWLGAIANSLQAGFWEECMFRAIPIAGAALIGDRFGRRGLFVAIAFVIQAVVFGAGHAPYPAQPAFARPVELLLPSIGFGLLYLWFGLLPAIVLHFAFDVVWFALPLFASTAPGVWVQQVMVVIVTLVPLWVVFLRRGQVGRWTALDAQLTNAAWTPPAAEDESEPVRVRRSRPLAPGVGTAWMALGAIGLTGVIVVSVVRSEPAGLPIGRTEAEAAGRAALAARGVDLGPPWRVMLAPENGVDVAHAFVSETAGEARRQALVGRYLSRPRWRVRVARFEGDVADRAEEWRAYAWSADEVGFIQHTLPEGRSGASLDEEAARALAVDAMRRERGLDAAAGELREVAARPTRLAERTDWLFTFADTTVDPLPQGELRISVRIAGDEVAGGSPFVFIPDDWQRDRRASETLATVLQIGAAALFGILLVVVAALGIRAWSRGEFSTRSFVLIAALVLLASVVNAINSWPGMESTLSTAQPFRLQVIGVAGAGLVAAVVLAAVHGLAIGFLPRRVPAERLPKRDAVRLGIAGGVAAAGALAVARWVQTPGWAAAPDLSALGSYLPALQIALAPVVTLITRTALVLGVLLYVDRLTLGWSERRVRGAAALAVVGFFGVASPDAGNGATWILAGVIGAAALVAFYTTLARADLSMVPIALAALAVVQLVRLGLSSPFPGAIAGSIGGFVATVMVGWWLFSVLRAQRPGAAPDARLAV